MLNKIAAATLAVSLAFLSGQARTADAQAVPMIGFGSDGMYDPGTGDYEGEGIMSHMGRISYEGNVQIVEELIPPPGSFFAASFEGTQVAVAANGDTMDTTLSGVVLLGIDPQTGLVSGTWLLEWEIVGGTGRFEGASGTLVGSAINPPFVPEPETPWLFNWSFEGTLVKARP